MTMMPMKAHVFNERHLRPSGFLQPKLDGIRMVWDGANGWSKTGKRFVCAPRLFATLRERLPGVMLDGELIVHGQSLQYVQSIVGRTVTLNEVEYLVYAVFDAPYPNMPFHERFQIASQAVTRARYHRLHMVDTIPLHEADGLSFDQLNYFAREGYEGSMWRDRDSLYVEEQRNFNTMKMKYWQDDEFVVVGVKEEFAAEKVIVPAGTPGSKPYADGRHYKDGEKTGKGMVGALVCALPNGKTVDVAGLTVALKKEYWETPPVGKKATVKYQYLSEDGVPIFPKFKGLRLID